MRNSEKRARVETMKARHQALATGQEKLVVQSPRLFKIFGQHFPPAEAARAATRTARFSGSKPQSRERFTTERIGRRQVTRKA